MNENSPTLGSLIRALRARNEWTLKEMSDRTGIPLSTLAKVEHDRLTLGYDKLLQISQKLNMRMSELFAGDESETRGKTRRSVGTLDTAVRVASGNYEYFFMCPELRKKRMIPLVARPCARTLEAFGELVRHAGEEFIYVLTGRVEVHTEFYETVTLEVGQCMYVDSNMGHAYLLGAGCDEALMVGACSSVDEGLLNSLTKPLHGERPETKNKMDDVVSKKPKPTSPRAKIRRR